MLDSATRAKSRGLSADWSSADDNRLRDAGGRYAALSALSDETGISVTALTARWHLLRAGWVRGVDTRTAQTSEDADFAALLKVVSPRMAQVAHILRRGTPLTTVELAERLEVKSGTLSQTLRANKARIAETGRWRLLMVQVYSLGKPCSRITLIYERAA